MSDHPAFTDTNYLYLFDIDGTLITSGGAGEASYRVAVEKFCGSLDPLKGVNFAGNTDTGIARSVLLASGKEPTNEAINSLHALYLSILAKKIHHYQGKLLPGIVPLLDNLKKKSGSFIGLLTGNLVAGAELKLIHYGLWHYFPFGAYADDHSERNCLGSIATSRAFEKYNKKFRSDQIYIIGDTPCDIECGKACNAKTVAVATGKFSRIELATHNPDFLFDDFSDVDTVMSAIAPC